jgi:dTDP-4-dehydrorhamnose reductase
MNKILITGHKGMLGRALVDVAQRLGKDFTGLDLPECDLTSRKQVETAVFDCEPDFILHGAAYTAVDKAESDAAMAYLVNATGTQNICLAAQSLGIPLMHISTDYVFDGTKEGPYDEWDAANPQSVYGKSKYAGEFFVRSLCPMHYIVRISWLIGHGGANFVETMLKLAADKPALTVVNDQHGSPTFVNDLAPELFRLAENGAYGTYHITNQGFTTWFDLARKIMELTGSQTVVNPIRAIDYPRPAPRPKNSCLSPRLYENAIGIRMPSWEEGLKKYLDER